LPKRIQMSRQHPWRADNPDAVIVARPSPYGNPFRVGMEWPELLDGEPIGPITDAARAVEVFVAWLYGRVPSLPLPDDFDWRSAIAGRDLACWCPLDQPCHADVLLELANPKEAPDAR
jgi:hypothetical protein